MKAIVDDKIPYIRGPIQTLVEEVRFLRGNEITADDMRDADILIVRTRTRVNERLLRDSHVRLVVTATIGYDHINAAYLESRGIAWTNCPGCNATSVVQYVHNSLLALDWLKPGLTVGVVGVGHVGSRVAEDLRQAGMNVMLCDPPLADLEAADMNSSPERGGGAKRRRGLYLSLEDMAPQCDIITFHTPLTHDGPYPTYHMADEHFFDLIQHRRPVIINAARGGVVDEAALLRAMDREQVSNVVIDTWEGEPDINPTLLERADIATPHIAGYSADGKANATMMSLRAVADFLHKPLKVEICLPTLPADYSYGTEKVGPLRLYDPRTDSMRLKSNPEMFEALRGNYPLRREQ